MTIYLPKNIFTLLLYNALNEQLKSKVHFANAIQIPSLIEQDSDAVGLITPADLFQHSELSISSKVGVSFTGELCNSYLYFSENKEFKEVLLAGDITTLEAIYAEIFFQEQYDTLITLSVLKERKLVNNENVLLIGDGNFVEDRYVKGASFSGEIIDMLEVPFVNFVFASKEKEKLEELNKDLAGIESTIYNLVEERKVELNLSEKSTDYFREEISTVIFEFNEQDIEGIKQLTRLAFYYGKTKDIIDLTFV